MKIKFYSFYKDVLDTPKPAKLFIPEAYKKMSTVVGKKIGDRSVKGCIPFLDAYQTGYIISSPTEIHCYYDFEEKAMKFDFPVGTKKEEGDNFGITTHGQEQMAPDLRYNRRTIDAIFKFNNHWRVQTPKGYSCLFTQPLNQNCPFKVIDAVVDTDDHPLPVNFPFFWTHDAEKPYIIKKGDPIMQIIPFKRDEWTMETHQENYKELQENHIKWKTYLYDIYKRLVWKKKSYK